MPLMLLKFLPAFKYIGIALALFAAYRYIVNVAETRMKLERAVQAAMLVKTSRKTEGNIAAKIGQIDQKTGETIRQIETVRQTVIKPTIEREIRSEVRLSNPDAGITSGLLEALNRGRKLSHSIGPAGSITIPLPAPEPAN